jgi:hypothetical protein
MQFTDLNPTTLHKSEEYFRAILLFKVAYYFQRSEGTIFGGFVRDLILLQNEIAKFKEEFPDQDFWDPAVGNLKKRIILPKDIDVAFTEVRVHCIFERLKKYVSSNFQKNGFYWDISGVNLEKVDYPTEAGVFRIKAVLTNSELFFGKLISIDCDLVFSDKKPPFGRPDMECNMLCFGRGMNVNVLRGEGSPWKESSAMNEELLKMRIIGRLLNKVTFAYPYVHSPEEPFRPDRVRDRISRVKRVIRMLKKGFKIENIKDISLVQNMNNLASTTEISSVTSELSSQGEGVYVCLICQGAEDDESKPDLHLNCCNNFAHSTCLEQYANDEFQKRVHLRCPGNCAKRKEHWDII